MRFFMEDCHGHKIGPRNDRFLCWWGKAATLHAVR